jgi:plastocyanin
MRKGLIAAVATLCIVVHAHAGDISGKVVFSGTPPKPVRIMTNADPKCMAQHKEPMFSEDVVVNKNNTLKNVIVYVKDGLGNKTFTPPAQKALFDQKACRYAPHVLGVQVGQEVEIRNSDPTLHNVHSVSKENPQFNVAQPKEGMTMTRKFDKPETFKVKCEVHPWMSAYIGVFNNPYFVVTGEDGSFALKGLPPGEYTLEAWHERYGTQTAKVKVERTGSVTRDFTFTAGK